MKIVPKIDVLIIKDLFIEFPFFLFFIIFKMFTINKIKNIVGIPKKIPKEKIVDILFSPHYIFYFYKHTLIFKN